MINLDIPLLSGSLLGSDGNNNIFSGFPTMSDCDVFINNENVVEIVALIKKVISSNCKCEAKIAYLNDFIG